MYKFFLSVLLAGLLVFCFSQNFPGSNPVELFNRYLLADKLYKEAERLSFSDNDADYERAEQQYLQALSAFKKLLPAVKKNGSDSLLFFILSKTAFIEYYFDSLDAAKANYLSAIHLKKNQQHIPDSFAFQPLLFTGSIYYAKNEFDSALVFYKMAEEVHDMYDQPLAESQRLYNRLGVMHYQNGNYKQANNYFEKAISVLSINEPGNNGLLVNYKINIASLLIKLEEFEKAKAIYESLLPNEEFQNEIFHNLSIIELNLGNDSNALGYLRKIDYGYSKKNIDLFYNYAMAFSALNEDDSSNFYLQKALEENQQLNGQKKNIPYGLILKFQADEMVKEKKYENAIHKYQQAITQFDNNFNTTDTYYNPVEYSSIFSFINLFNTLTAKANAFKKLYEQGKDIKTLEASLDTYQSAFALADYVERTYDSDEARLFLNKIKYTVHHEPIDVSLQLFELTGDNKYLGDAYLFDQRNKASTLSLDVSENELRNSLSNSNEQLRRESSIKSAITRLSLQAASVTDSIALKNITTKIRDQEIELSKIQAKLKDDPDWQKRQAIDRIPSVNELQKTLDKKTAILSYHLSPERLLILVIAKKKFDYTISPVTKDFIPEITLLRNELHNVAESNKFNNDIATSLYGKLIAPIEEKIAGFDRLIIIPDDELNYLPFEALQDEHNNYLIEKYAVQYQFSTAFQHRKNISFPGKETLAFAPFAYKGRVDSSGTKLNILPSSADEISSLQGKINIDSSATKSNFLSLADHYNIIHLATHASVNNQNPLQSYISFYPSNNDYKLYAREIYDLNLDSASLVILSACETGTGQLIRGEGLMSLTRAFSYAGCPNIVASLWKAEDKTTAFIMTRFHSYINKGSNIDVALQRAKLDLLNDKDVDPRYKNPAYWSHLVFVGVYEPTKPISTWWWVLAGAATAAIVLIAFFSPKRKTNPQ